MNRKTRVILFLLIACSLSGICLSATEVNLADHDVHGGLVVVLDCGDSSLLAGLRNQGSFLVHGLEQSAARVESLRKELQAGGGYGPITVDLWDGKVLPLVSGTVNAVLSPSGKPNDEIRRVLAPRGVVVAGDKCLYRQPIPKEIDEWTHYRYDPSNNNVSRDYKVAPPRSLKWAAGPEMARHHDHLPSLTAMVSAGGRVFYIFDEASSASILFPPEWRLIARDAFNGVLLWKKKIPEWHPHLWPLKSMPATLPRRLVSIGNSIFVTMGIRAPVSQLDARDGSEIRIFEGSSRCEEIIVSGNTLLALRLTGKGPLDDIEGGETKGADFLDYRATKAPFFRKLGGSAMSGLWLHAERRLIAYDITTGKEIWHVDGKFAPMSLAMAGKRIYFHDSQSVVALNSENGKQIWKSKEVPIWKEFQSWYGASLVVCDDVVLFSGGENMKWYAPGMHPSVDSMTALSAVDGSKLWEAEHPSSGYRSPQDLMVVKNLVWAGNFVNWAGNSRNPKSSNILKGRNLRTGEVEIEHKIPFAVRFHHRCHPTKSTIRYLIASVVGVNMINFEDGTVDNNDWVRGSCGYGILPANGLIYATPDPCNCFPESKLNGFVALAGKDAKVSGAGRSDTEKPVKGPAYGKIKVSVPLGSPKIPSEGGGPQPAGDWPTYRRDASRCGASHSAIPVNLDQGWKIDLGGKLTAPVISGGRVYLASVDAHMVVAVDSKTGRVIWRRTTGGRVDSPPTVLGDAVYFGSADGKVTCLRASDGELVWQYRVAPENRMLVSEGRLESVWPVHGSVLYHNGLIYTVAGRSKFVDGGLYMCGLDPVTGEPKVRQNHMLTEKVFTHSLDTEPALTDILSASHDGIYMRSQAYDLQCKPSESTSRHVFASNGFLADNWFHRSFLVYGKNFSGGCGGFGRTGNANHSGRVMVSDGNTLYGFGRTSYGWGSAFSYRLYAADISGDEAKASKGKRRGRKAKLWSVDVPILVRSMVKAGDKLVLAGPLKLYDEREAVQRFKNPETEKKIAAQAQTWQQNAELLIISASDGSVKRRMTLPYMPVWDGMAVAGNALFISGNNGALHCMTK